MHVKLTPNVAAVVRADPVLASCIEALRRDARGGYLNLFRSSQVGPFLAVYTTFDDDQPIRTEATSRLLEDAILRAVEAQDAAA